MNFSITANQPISDDIKKRIESVRESITQFQILQESIFNEGVSTMVSLDLGLPYYIQHVSSGKVLTMLDDPSHNLVLENKPITFTKFQEWHFKKSETHTDINNLYTISSNKNELCLSYDTTSITGSHVIKILECTDTKSLWKVENQSDAYKTIKTYPSEKTVEYNSNNELILNVTNNRLNDIKNEQSWIIKPTIEGFIQMRNDLTREINNIKVLVNNILPNGKSYKSAMESNAERLIQTMNTLEQTLVALDEKRKHIAENNPEYDPVLLEGKFQNATLDTNTRFYKYGMYLIFAIFITISVIYIYFNPEETSLDMFMLIFAIFILIYYIYDYIKKKYKVF